MSRKLIAPGIYEYPLDSLEEAKKDAHWRANDNDKTFRKDKRTCHVLTDKQRRGYYGPVGNHWETDIVWRGCVLVYTAEPEGE